MNWLNGTYRRSHIRYDLLSKRMSELEWVSKLDEHEARLIHWITNYFSEKIKYDGIFSKVNQHVKDSIETRLEGIKRYKSNFRELMKKADKNQLEICLEFVKTQLKTDVYEDNVSCRIAGKVYNKLLNRAKKRGFNDLVSYYRGWVPERQ